MTVNRVIRERISRQTYQAAAVTRRYCAVDPYASKKTLRATWDARNRELRTLDRMRARRDAGVVS